MKKTISIFMIIICTLCVLTSCKPTANDITLNTDKSFFWGYDVEEENLVNVYYNMNFTNKSSSEIKFNIKAKFEDLSQKGLVTNNEIYACNNKGEKSVFKLDPNSSKSIMIQFYDKFGGTEIEESSIEGLPKDIVFEIVE
ncbi:MAG: hypothetical protein RR549_03170 [Oscillospiraceae bacterium]